MNQYGLQAKEWWQKNAPRRYETLEDPEQYFEDLGEQVAEQVSSLSLQLQGKDEPNETTMEKAARLAASQRQAEEIVKADLVWIEPEKDSEALREEWESARPMDDAILEWAMTFVEGQGPRHQFSEMAEQWMLPEAFFETLADSETPWAVMKANQTLLQEAANRRFRRWLASGAMAGQE